MFGMTATQDFMDVDGEADRVAQASALGALADDLVGDLMLIRAGSLAPGASHHLRAAVDVFERAVDPASNRENLWTAHSPRQTFRILAGSHVADRAAGGDSSATEWIRSVARALARVRDGDAGQDVLSDLIAVFSALSLSTIALTQDALRSQRDFAQWSTVSGSI